MLAVYWHADSPDRAKGDTYRKLCEGFYRQCQRFGLRVVHLTTPGHYTFADETIYFDYNPKDVILNRERAFCEYLKGCDDLIWFTEPDCEIIKMFAPTAEDCCFLSRANDGVSMNPAWRMARKAALPIFEELRDEVEMSGKPRWDGDSNAFIAVHQRMGSPFASVKKGTRIVYRGISVEFRDYANYIKGSPIYTRNYVDSRKADLIAKWGMR